MKTAYFAVVVDRVRSILDSTTIVDDVTAHPIHHHRHGNDSVDWWCFYRSLKVFVLASADEASRRVMLGDMFELFELCVGRTSSHQSKHTQ